MLETLVGDLDALPIIIIRCVAVYLFMVLALRFFGKKEIAQLSIADFVFIILIGNSVQNAMVGTDDSLLGGLIAALILFILNTLLKKILKNKKASELLQGKPVILIYDGRLLDDHLTEVGITREEIDAVIREHGLASVEHVQLSVLEVDGNISIIGKDQHIKRSKRKIGHKVV